VTLDWSLSARALHVDTLFVYFSLDTTLDCECLLREGRGISQRIS